MTTPNPAAGKLRLPTYSKTTGDSRGRDRERWDGSGRGVGLI